MRNEFITAETRESIGIITINNPKNLNAINAKILQELAEQIEEYDNNNKILCIVLKGIEKSFAAGLDIKEIAANLSQAQTLMHDMQHNFQVLATAKKPLIAAVSGFVLGAGCEIVLGCDIVLATDSAKFGLPELSIGLLPCFGGVSALVSRIGKAKAMDMLLTGKALSADEAERAGLISRIVNESSLEEEYIKIGRRIAALPKNTVALLKKLIFETNKNQNVLLENVLSRYCLDSDDFKNSLANFAAKTTSTPPNT